MEKRNKWIYWISTGLVSVMILAGVAMYFFDHEEVAKHYMELGFPTWLIYPLGIAKILGLTAIWTRKSELLREWAYAGFVFELLLGVGAHISVGDGEFAPAGVALIMVLISYTFGKQKA